MGEPQAVRWPWLLSDAGVLTAVLVVAGVGVVALVVMLQIAGDAPVAERAKLQIETLKYSLGFFAAAGAVAALLLGVRRQRLSEHTHELALKTQAHTEIDATERRVTDLYTKAVEQLGSADAAVRLGGLYALERVAQNNPRQRQTIVNVLCAYLRMPYTPPAGTTPTDPTPVTTGPLTALPIGSGTTTPPAGRDAHQELQVRLTAQRILTAHLTLPPDVAPDEAKSLTADPGQQFWPVIDLDLTGAALTDWTMHRGHVRTAAFTNATFTGDAGFAGATFTGHTTFAEATFTGDAWFSKATFTGDAVFDKATFTGHARFAEATFTRTPVFAEATFTGDARFHKVGRADLGNARVALRENRNDIWPPGWRLALGTEACQLVYETPATKAAQTPSALTVGPPPRALDQLLGG